MDDMRGRLTGKEDEGHGWRGENDGYERPGRRATGGGDLRRRTRNDAGNGTAHSRVAEADQEVALFENARSVPNDGCIDSTLALARDPYGFIAKRCSRLKTDVFRTRLSLKPAICMSGPKAARLFDNPEYFQRAGAQPARTQKILSGKTGVQQVDEENHRRRKQMLLSLMTPERIQNLAQINRRLWRVYAEKWKLQDQTVLYPELCRMLTETVCNWAGVPLDESEVAGRTEELIVQFHSGRRFGPAYWRARIIRKRAERWARQVITRIRRSQLKAPESSAALVIARYRELNGKQPDPYTAGVELLNVLRPTVGVAILVTFLAHALHENPQCQILLQNGKKGYDEMFVQEVRRFYPFIPALIARTARNFEWNGFAFPAHTRTLLDIYGTNHDPGVWAAPDIFLPERFDNTRVTPLDCVPHTEGDAAAGHPGPAEVTAVELMKVAVKFLTRHLSYSVPGQNLEINFRRLPAMIQDGFVIRDVQLV